MIPHPDFIPGIKFKILAGAKGDKRKRNTNTNKDNQIDDDPSPLKKVNKNKNDNNKKEDEMSDDIDDEIKYAKYRTQWMRDQRANESVEEKEPKPRAVKQMDHLPTYSRSIR